MSLVLLVVGHFLKHLGLRQTKKYSTIIGSNQDIVVVLISTFFVFNYVLYC